MYRILSLDGFGSWSLIQVRALQELYGADTCGREVLSRFDLVASHASGSVVAAALAADWPLSKILNLFLDEAARKTVLVPAYCPSKSAVQRFGAARAAPGRRYEALVALLHPLANVPLHEIPDMVRTSRGTPVHFLFVGYDSERQKAILVRSDIQSAASELNCPARPKLVEAVYTASNVPADTLAGFRRNCGGLCGITNPLMAGVTEALANGKSRDEIEVLSIGTASVRLPLSGSMDEQGTLYRADPHGDYSSDGRSFNSPQGDDPPDASAFMAHVILGQPLPSTKFAVPIGSGSVVRMNPMVEAITNSQGGVYLPNLANSAYAPGMSSDTIFSKLVALSATAADQEHISMIRTLAEAWIGDKAVNQSIRPDIRGQCEIGHRWFSEAKDAWLAREHLGQLARGAGVIGDKQRITSRTGHAAFV